MPDSSRKPPTRPARRRALKVLAALPVLAAFRLRDQFRQPWLSPYVSYLAAWGAVVLLSVGQYMLLGTFMDSITMMLVTIPMVIPLMKDLGYGKGYAYDHDQDSAFSGQNYFPDGMARQQFYRPVERGFEREVAKRLAYWQKLREEKSDPRDGAQT